MKMRPGELLLDKLDSIEDTKVNTLTNLYSHKSNLCLFVCLIITHEPLDRFASNFDFENSGDPRKCSQLGFEILN